MRTASWVNLRTLIVTARPTMKQLPVISESKRTKVSLILQYLIFDIDYSMARDKLAGESGTLNILSKIGGWMTVTPRRMSRKGPIDKE